MRRLLAAAWFVVSLMVLAAFGLTFGGCASKLRRTYPGGMVDEWKFGPGNKVKFYPDPAKPIEIGPDENVVAAIKETGQAGGTYVIDKTFELLNKQTEPQQ